MNLIKFVTKLFTAADKLDESTVELVVELPPKTKQELFDDAVLEVVTSKLKVAVINSLREACYSDEIVEQTNLAAASYGYGRLSCKQVGSMAVKYPKALYRSDGYQHYFVGLPFNEEFLAERLIKAALKEDEDLTKE